MNDSYMQRHTAAMLNPATPTEERLAGMYAQLAGFADQVGGSPDGAKAVQLLASGLLLGLQMFDEPGRIDKQAFDKQVRDVVRRAGGEPDDV